MAARISESDTATPSSAVTSGSPAATNEAKVNSSTTNATTMPTSSVTLIPAGLWANTWPPTATCEPGGSACASSLPAAWNASAVEGSTADCATDSWMGTSAARPSALRFPVDVPPYGDVADETCGRRAMSAAVFSTACWNAGSCTVPPLGVTAMS